ncbi:MAG: trimethylamine methyltransferase family protein [Proteobacteria bacterium]|nr:trimethylamine methyltransferase family protein [Pseudomonadota bacterium]
MEQIEYQQFLDPRLQPDDFQNHFALRSSKADRAVWLSVTERTGAKTCRVFDEALADRTERGMRPQLRVVPADLVTPILAEAKRILAEIGVEVRGAALRQRLLDHGLKAARTADDAERVLFPEDVVDRALHTAPKAITLFSRGGQPHADLSGNNVHFVPGSSGLQLLDHRTNQTRQATTRDFIEYVRVADRLKHIAYLATAFSTNDIEPQISDAWRLYLVLSNSSKPVVSGAFTEHGVPRMAEMMQLFRRDRIDMVARPMSIFTVTASGSFRYSEDSCQNLLDCVEFGIPIELVPVTLMGLTAPVTLVGATVMHVADVLAGLTMTQVIKPGSPVLFGGAPATFHMSSTMSPMAAIETLHLNLAYIEIAKALEVPTQTYMALSEGKFLDAQAGAETFAGALLAATAGVNSVSGPGMLDYVLTFSLEKLVFDDELCGQALHFCRDFSVKEDLPAIGLVRQLLSEKHLLTARHTLDHWPRELYLPGRVIDRTSRESWQAQGAAQLDERVKAEVERHLREYVSPPPDERADAEMRSLIKSGLRGGQPLPEVLPPVAAGASGDAPARRRRVGRRATSA